MFPDDNLDTLVTNEAGEPLKGAMSLILILLPLNFNPLTPYSMSISVPLRISFKKNQMYIIAHVFYMHACSSLVGNTIFFIRK